MKDKEYLAGVMVHFPPDVMCLIATTAAGKKKPVRMLGRAPHGLKWQCIQHCINGSTFKLVKATEEESNE